MMARWPVDIVVLIICEVLLTPSLSLTHEHVWYSGWYHVLNLGLELGIGKLLSGVSWFRANTRFYCPERSFTE